ncbi:MAG TPA: glycosyltransferase family 39 protein [Polyangiaceae bacterium]|nr:glycosyltransferase family 39 protein [Polyangiaceae bacterium]
MLAAKRSMSATTESLAEGIVTAATLWYAVALCWCLFARIGAGHDALDASRGMMAENMLHWHIIGPVREYTIGKPTVDQYYSHHPYGTYWLITTLSAVLGRHSYVPRLVSVLMSAACPPMLYGIGRRLWGIPYGALCAAGYVVVPMTLAFGNMPGFEPPTVFAALLTSWGYLRFMEGWKRRWMLVSLLGVLVGVNADWNYVLYLGPVLGVLVLAGYFLPPRWFGRVKTRRFGQWALLAAGIAAVSVVAWFWYFHQIHALENLLSSDAKRSRGSDIPVDVVLEARSWWIDVTFTSLAILVGKIALPLFLIRFLFGRKLLEVFPLAIFTMAAITYLKFKNGADVHIYWPFAFGAYFALALGVLARSTVAVVQWVMKRFKRPDRREFVPLGGLVLFTLVPFAILPDGVDGLRYGKETGGRFDEKGTRAFRDVDKAQALEWMGARMQADRIVGLHNEMKTTWANDWALHHRTRSEGEPFKDAPPEERYAVADLRFIGSGQMKNLANDHKMFVVDDWVMADREQPHGPLEAYVFDERQPKWWEWYFQYGTEPVRTIRPDAWATWELRDALGQQPNPYPTDTPHTLEQLRIAHNIAVAKGDTDAATALEQKILGQLDTHVAAAFDDGTRLLGQKYESGVQKELTLMFRAPGAAHDDWEFALDSQVVKRKPLSLVAPDSKIEQGGAPFRVPPTLWRTGFFYAEHAVIHKRPGREHFQGRFEPLERGKPVPKLVGGTGEVSLLDLD